jgi:hypothetical protein
MVGTTLCVGVVGKHRRSMGITIHMGSRFQECTIVGLVEVVSCWFEVVMENMKR